MILTSNVASTNTSTTLPITTTLPRIFTTFPTTPTISPAFTVSYTTSVTFTINVPIITILLPGMRHHLFMKFKTL